MIDQMIARAEILIEQKRYAEAKTLLREALSSEPDHMHVLVLLAEVNIQLDNPKEADQLIDSALAISPDLGHLFYIKARVSLQKEDLNSAERQLQQALQLDPEDADYHALWAHVKLMRKQYEPALDLANKALELDGENLLALNTRSTALLKLDRKAESFQTIEGALREDPDNVYTHSNYGWGLLEKGDHKKAMEHFREALRRSPNFHHAQAGMMESIKAANPFYRAFLKFAFWMSNLTAQYQWGVLIGFYVGVRILRAIAATNESPSPFLIPIIILLSLFAFFTWIITPLSNLFLRFHPFGKHLLSPNEIRSSNFVAGSLAVCLISVVLYFITRNPNFFAPAIAGFILMVPYSAMFRASKPKNALTIYAFALTAAAVLGIIGTFLTDNPTNLAMVILFLGFVAFQWVANYMSIQQNNR